MYGNNKTIAASHCLYFHFCRRVSVKEVRSISNDDELGEQLMGFLIQFLEVFSELKGNTYGFPEKV